MLRKAAGLLSGAFLFSSLVVAAASLQPPQPANEPPPEKKFKGEISVSLVSMVLRAVDTWGRPILGLTPEDFRVRVGKREIPVVAVDWIAADELQATVEPVATADADDVAEPGADGPIAAPPPGRLVVFFVQADLNPTRISGHLRMRPRTRDLLDALHLGDQAAVVSFDSHLKMWLDFTRDHDAVQAALGKAMLYSHEEDILLAKDVSLARRLDFAAARGAATPERALEVTAQALRSLPGEKTMIYLGWGLGRFVGSASPGGVVMTPDYRPARKALHDAHVSVFVLDVTSADGHSLEVGLEQVAADTGGLYLRTFRQPNLAVEVLSQAISGYYVVTVDRSQIIGEGEIRVELRQKNGSVLARPVSLR